jgi:4'-phosphopantetheinyl transferase
MCAIAPADAAIGCDLEVIEPRSEGFVADYFSEDEQALVARVRSADRPLFVTLLWSVKESALKALHIGLRLDTRSIVVNLHDDPQPSEETRSAEDDPFCFRLLSGNRGWRTLQVRDPWGRILVGWWQQDSAKLLRTLVAAPAPNQPILLNLPSKASPAQKEASHDTNYSAA